MKQLTVTILFLFAALIGFAHPSSTTQGNEIESGTPVLTAIQEVGFPAGLQVNQPAAVKATAFGKCTFKINMEVNGVQVEGTLTIEDINFLECAALKIGKFFSDLF